MKLTLDTKTIQSINLFQNMTGCSVIDYIEDETDIYLVVAQGQYGLAVGKGGERIKHAEKIFRKSIKIFEFFEDVDQFILSAVPETKEIEKKESAIYIKINPSDRSKVIGKDGRNIKVINRLLKHLFGVESMKVK